MTLIDYISASNSKWCRTIFPQEDNSSIVRRDIFVFKYFCKYLAKLGLYHILFLDTKDPNVQLALMKNDSRVKSSVILSLIRACINGGSISTAFGYYVDNNTAFNEDTLSIVTSQMPYFIRYKLNDTELELYKYNNSFETSQLIVSYRYYNKKYDEWYAIRWMLIEMINAYNISLLKYNKDKKNALNQLLCMNNLAIIRMFLRLISKYRTSINKTLFVKTFCPQFTLKDKIESFICLLRGMEPPIREYKLNI